MCRSNLGSEGYRGAQGAVVAQLAAGRDSQDVPVNPST